MKTQKYKQPKAWRVGFTQEGEAECMHPSNENTECDGIPSLRFCDCAKSIAKFYLLELEYSRRKNNGNFWNGQHEAYYLKEISTEAMNILRFVLSAGIGETRHGFRHGFPEGASPHDVNYILAMKFLRQIFVQVGWKYVPRDRESIYHSYIPERIFWKMFRLTRDFYSLKWDYSYGGEPWRQGIVLAMKTYKAICLGDFPKICIWLDTLINHCHNGGVLLNKFNCYDFQIQKILDEKQDGNINLLECIISGDDPRKNPHLWKFRGMKCDMCKKKLPLAPKE